jgi:hypothetical protein
MEVSDPDDIFAVFYREEVILTRILRKGNVVLLRSSQGEQDIEVLEARDVESAFVGRVAFVIRPWHYAIFSPGERREG